MILTGSPPWQESGYTFNMAKQYDHISQTNQLFIDQQKMFFVATAGCEGRVNVSPKGMDTLRVLNPNRIVWLNVTGSGNESAAHVTETKRMTLMWCAFEGKPLILRAYGKAQVIHQRDAAWAELIALFPVLPGARQIFDVAVDLVQTSCGMAVPYYDLVSERDDLQRWTEHKGQEKLVDYWREKNQFSIDGKPTHLFVDKS